MYKLDFVILILPLVLFLNFKLCSGYLFRYIHDDKHFLLLVFFWLMHFTSNLKIEQIMKKKSFTRKVFCQRVLRVDNFL